MRFLLFVIWAILAVMVKASVIVNPVTTSYVPATPVATSYQVVSRNVNRFIVPHVPTVSYPAYTSTWGGYPYNYRYGYGWGSYPYGHVHNYGYNYGYNTYPYAYGNSIW